ncbi:MAG: hypothetical protein BAJATHORv1_20267 [Candidatus Thorarchaeota archaeon]|nr:MAG: hypothetical protein BAJATHORv1_20267 [Candidatus Thorarchaeota archaeon]
MSNVYSDDEGVFLVLLARDTIEKYVREKEKLKIPDATPKKLKKKSGVFVTLNAVQGAKVSLRGCIGRPYPTQLLVEATIDSAIDAATRDPRFSPVNKQELDSIVVELSVLTPPQEIDYSNPDELVEKVKVGRDGLIVSKGLQRGLLLPQVPVEYNWTSKEFLQYTCRKAGLSLDAWKDSQTRFLSFQAEIFGEKIPRGPIIRDPNHPRC